MGGKEKIPSAIVISLDGSSVSGGVTRSPLPPNVRIYWHHGKQDPVQYRGHRLQTIKTILRPKTPQQLEMDEHALPQLGETFLRSGPLQFQQRALPLHMRQPLSQPPSTRSSLLTNSLGSHISTIGGLDCFNAGSIHLIT